MICKLLIITRKHPTKAKKSAGRAYWSKGIWRLHFVLFPLSIRYLHFFPTEYDWKRMSCSQFFPLSVLALCTKCEMVRDPGWLAGWLARGEVWVFDWCVHLIYNNILIRKIKWMTHNWYKQLVYNENVLILKTCITWYCHALHVLAHCITWLGLQFNREKVLMHPAVISFLHAHLPKLAPRMGDISGLYIDKHANLHQSELK